ncbi:hypothetical protein ABKY54_004155 [Vibrio harveyi]
MDGMIKHHPSWRFGQHHTVAWYPRFYYSGSIKHKLESDRDFIFKHLHCLPEELQKEASETYEEIFKRHLNKKQFRQARYEANKFLQVFTKTHCMPKREVELKTPSTPKAAGNSNWSQWVAKTRKAQQDSKKKIYLGGK